MKSKLSRLIAINVHIEKNDVNKDVGMPIGIVLWSLRNVFLSSVQFILSLHHPFWLKPFSEFFGIIFQPLQQLSLAKDHWRGFNTRNAHMVHIVNQIRSKMVYTS